MSSITLHHLSLQYKKPLFNDLNLTFPTKQISLITGPSGIGKSTLLQLMAGNAPAPQLKMSGSITFDRTPLEQIPATKRSHWVAMLFQDPGHQFTMPTGREEIEFALENQQLASDEIQSRTAAALEFSGVANLADRSVHQLSGGEQQKMALAVIIAMDSDIILLDEPFASIDHDSRTALLKQLNDLKQHHQKTIIIIDHNLAGYDQIADNVFDAKDQTIQKLDAKQKATLLKPFQEDFTEIRKRLQAQPSSEPTLNFHELQIKNDTRTLLETPQFTFMKDAITVVIGDNGVGKSTLFRAITRATKYQGTISFNQRPIQKMKLIPYLKRVAMVFQDAETQFLKMTVAEELALSMKQAVHQNYTDDEVNEILTALSLDQHKQQVVYTLSAGQKKKLQILEMLIMGTDILLLDEPFAGLDYQSLQVVTKLLRMAQQKYHQTFIIITHQLTGVESLVDHLVRFADHSLTYLGGK